MKNMLLLATAVFLYVFSHAQNVVEWKYTTKKLSDKTYEVRLMANVTGPWHIYSQSTPEGGPIPTSIKFNKNPLVNFHGEVKENGRIVQKHEEVFGIDVKYFEGDVEFVQQVKLKSNARTNLSGNIEFMACNDQQCLPPKTVSFSVTLN